MRTNYQKGRDKEYRIAAELKKQGFEIVQRTAGSHSPIDIIAIDKINKKILFVQSKPETISDKKIKEILEETFWLNNKFECEFELRC
jgi:Holliday junction resolvase